MKEARAFFATENDTIAFGARLGAALRAGDAVLLSGPLGAGKSVLARAAIKARSGEAEAASPTFGLAHSYDADGIEIMHMDLYRLTAPDDLIELGLDDALGTGAVLIEWAERAGAHLPAQWLLIRLEPAEKGRRITLRWTGDWNERAPALWAGIGDGDNGMTDLMANDYNQRADERAAFLDAAGWGAATHFPVKGDASTRSYTRLVDGARRAILMDAPRRAEAPSCPPDADEATRKALGTNASARLAGGNLHAFVAVSQALRAAGLSAPAVFATDAERGLALLEDLGDDLYARAIDHGTDEKALYEAAIDVLLDIQSRVAPPAPSDAYTMLSYDALALAVEASLFTEWYWKDRKGGDVPDDLGAEYRAIWHDLIAALPAPSVVVLRDYHAENLLWLPDRAGVGRVGLIDFQDALVGHRAYDLVSILEDARRDVPQALARAMIDRFTNGLAQRQADFDHAAFAAEYAIIAAQRNAKILGVFCRLALRDKKPAYRDLLPRVEAHFRRDLSAPALAPLKAFISRHFPELAP